MLITILHWADVVVSGGNGGGVGGRGASGTLTSRSPRKVAPPSSTVAALAPDQSRALLVT